MTTPNTDLAELTYQIRHAHRRATDSEWCLEENCRYRHWTSGGVPTHRRGSTCPPMPTLEAAVLPIVDAAVKRGQAEALRDAAHEFAEGAWSDQWLADGVDDDISAVQSTERWFNTRADRIEEETPDEQ